MEAVGREIVERGPAARPGWAAPAGAVDPDRELLERWRGGDLGAFEALVRRHEQRVFRLLVRMLGNAAEAEEVAQETFLNLHRHGRRFRGEARFSTFVYRVAANAALNWRRTLGRRRARERELLERHERGEDLATGPRDPEDAALGAEAQARVQQALLELPPALRMPVVLYDIEGQSYGEIAAILKLAEGTVKSRIFRARKALRERLEPLFSEVTAGESR
jgi:RNA polymerase sigma-70 factor (ECF subfamily)